MCCWPRSLFYHKQLYVVDSVIELYIIMNSHMLLAARPCIFILESLAMCCWPRSLFYHKQPYVVGSVIEL